MPQVGLLRKSNRALKVLLHQEFQGGLYLWQPTTRNGFTKRVKITATPMALISYLQLPDNIAKIPGETELLIERLTAMSVVADYIAD